LERWTRAPGSGRGRELTAPRRGEAGLARMARPIRTPESSRAVAGGSCYPVIVDWEDSRGWPARSLARTCRSSLGRTPCVGGRWIWAIPRLSPRARRREVALATRSKRARVAPATSSAEPMARAMGFTTMAHAEPRSSRRIGRVRDLFRRLPCCRVVPPARPSARAARLRPSLCPAGGPHGNQCAEDRHGASAPYWCPCVTAGTPSSVAARRMNSGVK
jgi:hypothetical protein